jgi:hypothetical protein
MLNVGRSDEDAPGGKESLTLGNYARASPDWAIKNPFLSVRAFWPQSALSHHDKPSEI